jgi:hypothetical protein
MMKKIVAVAAEQPRSKVSRNVAWVYTAVLIIMAVGQLFSFEKFIPIINNYGLPGGHGTATLFACLIVVAEVFALPFLVRMPLSPLMRWFSMFCGMLVAGLWIGLAVVGSGVSGLDNTGMFGTKVPVPAGLVQIVIALGLGVLAIWSASGLWPTRKK